MKTSSFFRLGAVIVLFVVIQGWLLSSLFIAPRIFRSSEAYLSGSTVQVSAPVTGTLQNVAVKEGDHVEQGQLLFVIRRSFVDPQSQRWMDETMSIFAEQSGTVTGISTVRGTFVQFEQKLATIINTSGDALRVDAVLSVAPRDVQYIRKMMSATVEGEFLRGGEPVEAVIRSVNPVYDGQGQRLGVQLQLLQYPDHLENMPLGLPVSVEVRKDRTADDNIVISLFRKVFPVTNSQDE